ncbi:nucleotide sugar dehydrogenase [Candidatus Pelagibacter sp.]|nr:nucleotide sugar dehydrogenase [Candidatus Pelagibacter sp.]MDA9136736.1 nucleotide sugar dehydrogenase [Candidatus Pelagibacter sp.]
MKYINYSKNLINKIKSKKTSIGVIGLGYVGLPLSILFAKKGFKVFGFDIDKSKINKIKSNNSYIERIKNNDIKLLNKNGTFSSKFNDITKCDIIILCVPTPLKYNKPYIQHIKSTIISIKSFLIKGQTIILESTSYPGTTNEEITKKLNKKFVVGNDLFIGFSSERINPGFNENKIQNVPKVVSGYSENCKKIISTFYSQVFSKIITADSIEIAEFSKLLENIYRSVNIGFINEMKLVADKFKLDIFEIIKIAASKPFGFKRFDPGPGTGGHCIPVDPIYLAYKSKKLGFNPRFIELSANTNIKVLSSIINKILNLLKKLRIPKEKAKILILGISYKKNVDDLRESAAIRLLDILLKKKIKNISFSDPHIKNSINTRVLTFNSKSININPHNLRKFDISILMTDHDKFNYKMIYKHSNNILDTRGKFKVDSKVTRA